MSELPWWAPGGYGVGEVPERRHFGDDDGEHHRSGLVYRGPDFGWVREETGEPDDDAGGVRLGPVFPQEVLMRLDSLGDFPRDPLAAEEEAATERQEARERGADSVERLTGSMVKHRRYGNGDGSNRGGTAAQQDIRTQDDTQYGDRGNWEIYYRMRSDLGSNPGSNLTIEVEHRNAP